MEELRKLQQEVAELKERISILTNALDRTADRVTKVEKPMIYNHIDKNMSDCAKEGVQYCIDTGIIKGTGEGLGLDDKDLKYCTMIGRIMERQESISVAMIERIMERGLIIMKTWIKAAGIMAVKTIAQTAIATIGTSAVMGDVNWIAVLSASVLAGILSLLQALRDCLNARRNKYD